MKNKVVPIIALSALLILAVTLALVPNGMVPSAMAAGTQDIVNAVKSDSNDTYDKIQKNIDKVTELKAQLTALKAESTPVDLNSIVKDIEAVTKSYEALANQRDYIEKNLAKELNLQLVQVPLMKF